MEPLSALSIATAVVQFLDFTGSILSGTWKVYRSNPGDTSEHNSDIRTITNSLVTLNEQLCTSIGHANSRPFSSKDQEIANLGKRCNELGKRLVSGLDQLRSQNKHQLWASVRLALKTIWTESEISALQQTLENYRQQISMHILVSLREQIATTLESQRQHDSETRTTLDQTQRLCVEILSQFGHTYRWQSDVVEAIKRSYGPNSPIPDTAAPQAHIHSMLYTKDVNDINSWILLSLRFNEIENRYERISPAHQKTFEWLFHPPSLSTVKWADFTQWIQSDDSLYWITGKAGAGKSTLMKFIYDHEHTAQSLQAWAVDRPLVIAYFFFWNSGTDVQMSYEGLLRTLLYQILTKIPDLIPLVFPHRVEAGILFGDHIFEKEPWTWEDLLRAFRILIAKVRDTHKLMFFIDGLDEYKGRASNLVDFIASLIAPSVKICASSRPWVVFEDAFSHRPHLRLEDLTSNDIGHYVTSKLTSNRGFEHLQQLDPIFSAKLIENLCVKSSGVFLWVILVTQSLLDGLSEGERLSDLQRRLDSLPADLENLFWKILDMLNPSHFQRACQLFQILRTSLTDLTLLDMSFADEDDPEFVAKAPFAFLAPNVAHSRAELMRRRMNACCKGLLEFDRTYDYLPSSRVSYLHRTVKDFLERDDTWSKVETGAGGDFNANWRLCNAWIMRFKMNDPGDLSVDWLGTVTYAIEYAVRSDPDCTTCQIPLLNEINRVATTLTTAQIRRGHCVVGTATPSSAEPAPYWTKVSDHFCETTSFLGFAVQCQLVEYIDLSLRAMTPLNAARNASQLLNRAVIWHRVTPDEVDRPAVYHAEPSKKLILLLLKYGADPNWEYRSGSYTAWYHLLTEVSVLAERWNLGKELAKVFLCCGADPRSPYIDGYASWFSTELKSLVRQKKSRTRWTHYRSKFRLSH